MNEAGCVDDGVGRPFFFFLFPEEHVGEGTFVAFVSGRLPVNTV